MRSNRIRITTNTNNMEEKDLFTLEDDRDLIAFAKYPSKFQTVKNIDGIEVQCDVNEGLRKAYLEGLEEGKLLKESDFKLMEALKEAVDWNDYRRIAAKDILTAMLANSKYYGQFPSETVCKMAIDCADNLIKQLKNGHTK